MSHSGARVAVGGAEGSGRGSLLECVAGPDGETPGFIDHWSSVADAAGRLAEGNWPTRGLIVVDAVRGVQPETQRDLNLLIALGIRDLVVVINKMDLAEFSEARFAELSELCQGLAAGAARCQVIPVSALTGDNVTSTSDRMAFYTGPPLATLLASPTVGSPHLEGSAGPADAFRVAIVWTAPQPLLPSRTYSLTLGDQVEIATVTPLRYRLDLDSGEHAAATTLAAGELGACDIELVKAIVPSLAPDETTAHFDLRDRLTDELVGIGVIEYPLRRADNVRWQVLSIGKPERAIHLGQKPTVLWLTGLSGAGKSTIANLVEGELYRRGHHTYLLDGDNVRHGLNSDLGFTATDRVENIRRVAEVARLMADAGLIVIVSFISPFRAERAMARELLGPEEFLEVWVDAPLEVAEQRDPKGLYRKARRGELINFTGIDSPYEPPERAEIHLDTSTSTPQQAAGRVVHALEQAGRLHVSARD